MTSLEYSDYGNGENDIAGTNYDWGVYNAIYNPKVNTTDAPGTWRTLTKDEWVYLLETRSTASGIRYAKSQVNGVNGLIIVPDDWDASIYTLNNTNTANVVYTSNSINNTDWTKIEAAGCIFLHASGCRGETSVYYVGSDGYYWSATYKDSYYAYSLDFYLMNVRPSNKDFRYHGESVRLVRDVE
jgi:hypothetical protein